MNDFQEEVTERVAAIPNDKDLCETAAAFMCVPQPGQSIPTASLGKVVPSSSTRKIWSLCRNTPGKSNPI
jgi:hypothetical protein